MQFLTLITLAFATGAIAAAGRRDQTSLANLVTYEINGKTVIGEPAQNETLGKRSAQCNDGENFAYGEACTPGNCDCQGNNGCWCWSDQPYCMCQCQPALGENYDCNCGLGNPCPDGF